MKNIIRNVLIGAFIIFIVDIIFLDGQYFNDVISFFSNESDTQNNSKQNQITTTAQNNQRTETPRQSLGNLKNTSWGYYSEYNAATLDNYGSAGWAMGSALVSHVERINFGNGDYIHTIDKNSSSLMHVSSRTEKGTFYVTGNTVVFNSSDGSEKRGNLSDNTLIIDNIFFSKY